MRWIPHPTIGQYLSVCVFWRNVAGFFFLLFLGAGPLWAQTTIYTWTDEHGVWHYSNSMVPSQYLAHSTAVEMSPRPPDQAPEATQTEQIPLVILNNDPSRKFVRTTLEGPSLAREALMLVDTGAQMTMLDEELADELHLEYIRDISIIGATGTGEAWVGHLSRLRLGRAEIKDLPVLVAPLSGRLLLGMDVIEQLRLAVGLRSLQRTP